MKKSVGEIERIAGGVAVLAFFQIASQDWSERRVIEESARQRIEQRRKAADARAPHQPSRAKHAVSLLQTGEPVFPFDQMVERAQEQLRPPWRRRGANGAHLQLAHSPADAAAGGTMPPAP